MKPFPKKHLLALLLLCFGSSLSAQKNMLAVVEQLIQAHPEAEIREEYRRDPSGTEQTYTERRRDIRIARAQLSREELQLVRRALDTEWGRVSEGLAGGARYEMEDSLSCTLIFKDPAAIAPPLKNSGYVMLNLGEYLSVTAQECALQKGLPPAADFTPLRQTLNDAARQLGAASKQVRYTGSNGYFLFQRGTGRGWTTGVRHVVQKASDEHFLRLWRLFGQFMESGSAVNIIRRNREVMVKDEIGREFFVISHTPAGRLAFLLANVDGEICIPVNWEEIDYFDNGEIRPQEAAPSRHKPTDSMSDVQKRNLLRQLEEARRKLIRTETKAGEFYLRELRRNRRCLEELLENGEVGQERKQEIRRELERLMKE